MRGGRFPAEKEGRELVEQPRPVDKGKFEMTTYNTNPFVAIAVGIAFEHDPTARIIRLDVLSHVLQQREPALSQYNCECAAAEALRKRPFEAEWRRLVEIALRLAFEHDPTAGVIPVELLSRLIQQREPTLLQHSCERVALEAHRQRLAEVERRKTLAAAELDEAAD